MSDTLTLARAGDLAVLISGVMHGVRVHYALTEAAVQATAGTLRHLVRDPQTFALARADDDVMGLFVRITTTTGTEKCLRVDQCLNLMSRGLMYVDNP